MAISNVEASGNLDKKNLGGELKDKIEASELGVGKASKQRK